MPYIITVKTPRSTARSARGTALENFEKRKTPDYDVTSTYAVTTLDAVTEAAMEIAEHSALLPESEGGEIMPEVVQEIASLPKDGGKIGPLPDGQVIKVEEVDFVQLRARAGIPFDERSGAEIIDAFNNAN